VFQREPHLLHPTVGKAGYPVWCYRIDHQEVRLTVPVTVATAFHGPCPTGLEVRHLDNNKLNNVATNLKWGTSAENAQDRVRAGTSLSGERNPHAKLTWDQVYSIRHYFKLWPHADLAFLFGVHVHTIKRILRNQTWKVAS